MPDMNCRTLGASGLTCLFISQPCYNALNRMPEVEHPPGRDYSGPGVAAYSPLARGVLAGKYLPGAIAGPRTFEQWNENLCALDYRFTAEDKALADSLAPPGHPPAPGGGPSYPLEGRIPRA